MHHVASDSCQRLGLAFVATALLAVLGSGCSSLKPADIPLDEDSIVVVRARHTQRDWIGWTHHSWIEVKDGSNDAWDAYHVRRAGVVIRPTSAKSVSGNRYSEESHPWWYPYHGVRAIYTGEPARTMIAQLKGKAEAYAKPSNKYRIWPGPNSNTFVETMLRSVGGLSSELSHNAVGKDHAHIVRLWPTSTKTGLWNSRRPCSAYSSASSKEPRCTLFS